MVLGVYGVFLENRNISSIRQFIKKITQVINNWWIISHLLVLLLPRLLFQQFLVSLSLTLSHQNSNRISF